MPIKLISLNIEAHNHLAKILPWLEKEHADVICLQELFKADLPIFEKHLNMTGHFLPLLKVSQPNDYRLEPLGEWGLGMLTNLPHGDFQSEFYLKHGQDIPELINGEPNSGDRALLWNTFTKQNQDFTIVTTHFTWSPAGNLISLQDTTYEAMTQILTKLPEFVLCGDFNSPRGKGGIYDRLAKKYIDHIPADIKTSIDANLHRAGHLEFMVDGLFSTPEYLTQNVQVIAGLSDHMAIKAKILKNQ